VASFVVAFASIAWLLGYPVRHTIDAFVYYRLGVAALLVCLLLGGARRDLALASQEACRIAPGPSGP
jgi:hypothetical protein